MPIFFKLIALAILLGMTVIFSTMEATVLDSIYKYIGGQLNISWIAFGGYSPLISDLGHGVIYFIITLISLTSFNKAHWKIAAWITLLAAVNEILQLFILSRQPSWYDFAYGLSGIIVALIIYTVITNTYSTS